MEKMKLNRDERDFVRMSLNGYTEETISEVMNLTESEYRALDEKLYNYINFLEGLTE